MRKLLGTPRWGGGWTEQKFIDTILVTTNPDVHRVTFFHIFLYFLSHHPDTAVTNLVIPSQQSWIFSHSVLANCSKKNLVETS